VVLAILNHVEIQPGLSKLKDLDFKTLASEAAAEGFKVFVLKQEIETRDAFFDAIRESIPLDPPIVSSRRL
jgi:hypothetical protein